MIPYNKQQNVVYFQMYYFFLQRCIFQRKRFFHSVSKFWALLFLQLTALIVFTYKQIPDSNMEIVTLETDFTPQRKRQNPHKQREVSKTSGLPGRQSSLRVLSLSECWLIHDKLEECSSEPPQGLQANPELLLNPKACFENRVLRTWECSWCLVFCCQRWPECSESSVSLPKLFHLPLRIVRNDIVVLALRWKLEIWFIKKKTVYVKIKLSSFLSTFFFSFCLL